MVFAKQGGGVDVERIEESRQQFEMAFSRMLGLTNAVRNELIGRRVREEFKGMGE